MRGLNAFLRRIAQSPELRDSEQFKQFVEADQAAYNAYITGSKNDGKGVGAKLGRWFGKKKQAVKESERAQAMGQKVGVTVEASHRVYTADDAEFDVLRVWIRQKCAHLGSYTWKLCFFCFLRALKCKALLRKKKKKLPIVPLRGLPITERA